MEKIIRVKLDDIMSKIVIDEDGAFLEVELDVFEDWIMEMSEVINYGDKQELRI